MSIWQRVGKTIGIIWSKPAVKAVVGIGAAIGAKALVRNSVASAALAEVAVGVMDGAVDAIDGDPTGDVT